MMATGPGHLRKRATSIGAVVAIVVGVLTPASAVADGKRPVQVEVWTIRATTKNAEISPELRGLAKVLKKQFKYTGFKLEKKAANRTALNNAWKTDLIGGYRIRVTPKSRSGSRIQLELAVLKQITDKGKKKEKTVLKTTLTVKPGPLMPVGCGSLDGGDYLITAIRAR